MFSGPLRLIAVAASLVVLLSFAAFAIDEARTGSKESQAGIVGQDLQARQNPASFASPTPA